MTPTHITPHAGEFLGGACTLCGLPPESPMHLSGGLPASFMPPHAFEPNEVFPEQCQRCTLRVWTSPHQLAPKFKPGEWHAFNGSRGVCVDCGESDFGGFHSKPAAKPHAYRPKGRARRSRGGIVCAPCAVCGGQPGETAHILNLPGIEPPPVVEAPAVDILDLLPPAQTLDITRAAEDMERHSPLFFGTGANPGLFN